jgi:hypothetical protein
MDERWEYQLISLANDRDHLQVEEAFNAVGNDGWEMIAVYPGAAAQNVFIFKRPKRA